MTTTVVEIEWTEKERGWGQRPDGYSYHRNMFEANDYIDKYWITLPNVPPECYSAPSTPKLVEVDPIFALLVDGKGVIHTEKSCKQ